MLASLMAVAAALSFEPQDVARFGVVCQPPSAYSSKAVSANIWAAIDAEQRADWPGYLAAIQKVASMQCPKGNWDGLAFGFLKTGKIDLALEAAERAFVNYPGSTDLALHGPDGRLRSLTAAPGYAESGLAARLKPLLAARAGRMAPFEAALASLTPSERPAERSVIKDACPGECCKLGRWTMAEAQATYASAGDAASIGQLPPGSVVDAIEGEVHVLAEPIGVGAPVKDSSGEIALKPGDLAFRLDHVGEGYTQYWVRGQVVLAEDHSLEGRCLAITDECWGDFLRPTHGRAEQLWWVKVRDAAGKVVWIKPAGRIEGKCGCC